MLFCQPREFYDELKYISTHQSEFMKKIEESEYKIPNNLTNIEPISYILEMIKKQPISNYTNNIFALRTYGVHDALEVNENIRYMQVYFACVDQGAIHITKPQTRHIIVRNNVLHYTTIDEFGDLFEFTLKEIAEEQNNPYAMYSYFSFGEHVFEPSNLLAKIPMILLPHLV